MLLLDSHQCNIVHRIGIYWTDSVIPEGVR